MKNFGNTSCATIPLTMVTEIRNELIMKKLNHIGCAFGVGLSWASVFFETDHIACPELIEY
ncbi:MAG: 3-oxoacyl-[acyl-carrier-protein] synthase III C-terminal domain-containing protein [Mangrovibacterium sp.]